MKINQTIQPCSAYIQGSTHRCMNAHFSLSAITNFIFSLPLAFPFAEFSLPAFNFQRRLSCVFILCVVFGGFLSDEKLQLNTNSTSIFQQGMHVACVCICDRYCGPACPTAFLPPKFTTNLKCPNSVQFIGLVFQWVSAAEGVKPRW